VDTLNLGGGYKVGRMAYEAKKSTDIQECGSEVQKMIQEFAQRTGRELKLEVEPGTFLVVNACSLVTTVQDKVETTTPVPPGFEQKFEGDDAVGQSGYTFLKLDSGMTEILRPSLYAAQHPLVIVPRGRDEQGVEDVVVVGHCCESGDLLTTGEDDAEEIKPRMLTKAEIGDVCVVEGAGAYCSSMSTKNYNSFPEAPEVMLHPNGKFSVVRRKQTLEQILQNELPASEGSDKAVSFTKYHGLGNDFVMVDNRAYSEPLLSSEQSIKVCQQHFGVGGDGVIFLMKPKELPDAEHRMFIYNSDGSIPEMCGNGIRCLAKFIQQVEGTTGQKCTYKIETGAGMITPTCLPSGQVVVDMGAPMISATDLKFQSQFTLPPTKDNMVIDQKLTVEGTDFSVTCVSMGNPHAVVFVDDIDTFDVKKFGPPFEVASAFPEKTNTEFVQVISPTHLKMKVWERGAAETLACGTGACALTVAAILAGKTDQRECTVTLPGGDLIISWKGNKEHVFMTGPADKIFTGMLSCNDLDEPSSKRLKM